jgi:poly-gamma-glutamate synthesis protein (capsule biosynthesis protein)
VKVGVIAYTYETAIVDGGRTMNGSAMSAETRALINSYSPGNNADLARIQASIAGAKADGAQVIVCYFHWGNEYERRPNDVQRQTAQFAADNGADIIFASHPHVVQPMEAIVSGTRQVPVFWSMGNYVSNQREETVQDKYTEQGIIAQMDLTYNVEEQKISNMTMSYTPFWVDKYKDGGRTMYAVVPLTEGFESNPSLLISGHTAKAAGALSDLTGLLGDAINIGMGE